MGCLGGLEGLGGLAALEDGWSWLKAWNLLELGYSRMRVLEFWTGSYSGIGMDRKQICLYDFCGDCSCTSKYASVLRQNRCLKIS